MSEVRFSIKVAARMTGLTPHVIRVWEKRYSAVSPDRTDTQRRLYSEEEVERLSLLGAATRSGHRIGDIARLPDDQLRELVANIAPGREPEPHADSSDAKILEVALDAVQQMDPVALERVFESASLSLGNHGFLDRMAGPLARAVGDQWFRGVITAGHEHFFSSELRAFLSRRFRSFAESDQAPGLVVVTPAGQLHELGAAIVAAAARDMGWRVAYLGANLPAADIAAAAVQQRATAVALSIVFPGDDPSLPGELEYLRRLLPEGVDLLAGGRAAVSYQSTLRAIRAIVASDLATLYDYLARRRMPGTEFDGRGRDAKHP